VQNGQAGFALALALELIGLPFALVSGTLFLNSSGCFGTAAGALVAEVTFAYN